MLFFFLSLIFCNFEFNGLIYREKDDESCQVIGCNSQDEIIEIPSFASNNGNNYTVVSISASAFSNATQIKELVFPETLTEIEYSAFVNKKNLTKVSYRNELGELVENTLPPNLTELESYVFQGSNIIAINTNNVEVINLFCFHQCIYLKDLKIPKVRKIKSHAFSNLQSLLTFEIPETLEEIADLSFMKSTLINVTGNPVSLTTLGQSFAGCSDLISLPHFPALKVIGSSCFVDCHNLKTISTGPNLTNIDSEAFSNCNSLVSFQSTSKQIFISPEAFIGCSSLTSFPFESVSEILTGAFTECTSLKVVNMTGAPLTEINPQIFTDCGVIETVVFPEGLQYLSDSAFFGTDVENLVFNGNGNFLNLDGMFIGNEVLTTVQFNKGCNVSLVDTFRDCKNLTKVFFASDCDAVLDSTFINCESLWHVSLPQKPVFLNSTFINCTSLYDVYYFHYITHVERAFMNCVGLMQLDSPNSLIYIGPYSFYNCQYLLQLPLYDSVTTIGEYAFYNCKNYGLGMINLSSVTSLGRGAFSGCDCIGKVVLPTSPYQLNETFADCKFLSEIENFKYCTYIEGGFSGCIMLTTIDSGDSLIEIGEDSFSECTALTSIEFGESLVNIGRYAFYDCEYLTSINLKNVKQTGMGSFQRCSRLKDVNFGNIEELGEYSFSYIQTLTSIELPPTLKVISQNCFMSTALVNITGDLSSLTTLDNSFVGCKDLINVPVFPAVVTIGANAFHDCTKITRVEFGSALKEIWSEAFHGCQSLVEFKTSSPAFLIAGEAFLNCYSLETFDFSKVTEIMYNAFEMCTSLKVADFSNSKITEIMGQTFQDCTSLSKVIFPPNLQSAPEAAFDNCPLEEIVFTGTNGSLILKSTFENYETLKTVTFADSCQVTLSSTFVNCPNLTTVNLPKTSVTLYNTFFNCTGLKNIAFPVAPISFGQNSFCQCTSLESVVLLDESSLQQITVERTAFQGCTSLVDFNFSNWHVSNIGEYAFYNCPLTEIISFNADQITIASNAFSSSVIQTIDFTSVNTINISETSFSNCSSISCVELNESSTNNVKDVFNDDLINGDKCPGHSETTTPDKALIIGIAVGLAVLTVIIVVIVVVIRKKKPSSRDGFKQIEEKALNTQNP